LGDQHVERRLSAILATDVVGYSRLTGVDEEGTYAQLQDHLRTLVEPKIAEHRGRVVKNTGDGLLAEFSSVVDAVRCALDVQRDMVQRNSDVPQEKRIEFRIGINVGDIIVDRGDIFGDGVNVAARLEALAEPGGICVSGRVLEDVQGKLDIAFEDAGEQQLKNIVRPVRVFRVGPGDAASTPRPALPLPDKPSIAVLPFQNMSGDPEQDYFADGIVEEIITGLSRIKWLFVISRNSTFIYKGKPVDVKAVARDLGVRYVLQGSVRRSGDHVRVTGQLIETESAAHVWADRYDGTLGDIFTLQDEMTMSVIGAVEPTLRKAEVERVRRKRPDNLGAYDLFLRALPLAATAMPEDAEKALSFLEEAIRLEPNYAAVHGFIAWCHEQRYLRGGLHAETRKAALVHAHAAIETGSDDAMALATGGFVVGILERDYETALEAIDRSLALSPSSAIAFGFSSIIRVLKGEDSTAIEHARMGIRLSPYDPLIYLPYVGLAYAHFFAGNFVEAASAANRASVANPRFSVPRYLHVAALVRLGRLDEAKAIADVLLELLPGFTVSGLVSGNITTPERMRILAEALHGAGLPK
jgi:TolB-like protein